MSVWRKVLRGLDLRRVLSLRYEAAVGNDNVIRLGGLEIQAPPGPGGRGYAGVRAEVRQLLDGSWRVYYKDTLIAVTQATEVSEPIRTLRRRKGIRAGSEAVWTYLASRPERLDDRSAGNTTTRRAAGTIRRAGPSRTIGASRIA